MMKYKHVVLVILLTAVLTISAQSFETAKDAVKNMGVGWNLGNTLDAHSGKVISDVEASETLWGQPVTKPKLLKMMKEAGFGAIRVPVTWYSHMDADGVVDAAWMARVREVVDAVLAQDMYCLLDVHHDTGADSEQTQSWLKASMEVYRAQQERFEQLWQQIAEAFKDYDHRLLFEGYNEMLDTMDSWCFASYQAAGGYSSTVARDAYDAINAYAQSFVNTVRATGGYNSQRNLVVNTYGACSGGGTWNTHLQDPLKEMKRPTDIVDDHLIFQVHTYPSLVNSNGSDRTLASVKKEVDQMISAWKTYLVSKNAPVIVGEWGTSNVDAATTDYDARRDLMLQFADYFVRQSKANDMATFYWMGLSNGQWRMPPLFNQPDLAKTIVQAYHGTDFQGLFPVKEDYAITTVVAFHSPWAELGLYSGAPLPVADYRSVKVELESAVPQGKIQIKVYGDAQGSGDYLTGYLPLTATQGEYTFSEAAQGKTITAISLQATVADVQVAVKRAILVLCDGTEVELELSPRWGCKIVDMIAIPTAISRLQVECPSDGRRYNLCGQPVSSAYQGIYVMNGKKVCPSKNGNK